MAQSEIRELKETLREQKFKLRAFAVVLQDLLDNAPQTVKARAHAGLFVLAFSYTRGQYPFEFKYNGRVVKEE